MGSGPSPRGDPNGRGRRMSRTADDGKVARGRPPDPATCSLIVRTNGYDRAGATAAASRRADPSPCGTASCRCGRRGAVLALPADRRHASQRAARLGARSRRCLARACARRCGCRVGRARRADILIGSEPKGVTHKPSKRPALAAMRTGKVAVKRTLVLGGDVMRVPAICSRLHNGDVAPLVVVCWDVEPDSRTPERGAADRWMSFERLVPRVEDLRDRIADLTGAPASFSWFLRMD